MKRRDLLKRVGTASVATLGVAGTASARSGPAIDVDREIDVSDVSGKVTLESILPTDTQAQISAPVDLSETQIMVAEDADTITPSGCCCCECDWDCVESCHHDCCAC